MTASYANMAAYTPVTSNLVGDGEPERLEGAAVSSDTLSVLDVPPALGRYMTADDDRAGAACAVWISDALWRRRFGATATALGRKILLDDESCVVSGVMRRGFDFPTRTTAFWRPLRLSPESRTARDDNFLRVIARLRPDVSYDQAKAELTAVATTLSSMYPKDLAETSAAVMPWRDELGDQPRTLLTALAGAAACLLLIVTTNLATLTMTRSAARARELAVRAALGAEAPRLARQLLTESLVLALIGGGCGFALALAAIPTVAKLVPTSLPLAEVPAPDARMLAIAAAATLGVGIGFGALPAFRASRGHIAAGDLREGGRTATGRMQRMHDGLVAAQIAISILLLVCAGLLTRALLQVRSTPPGFNADNVLTMRTTLPWGKYGAQATRVQFYRHVLDAVAPMPGVRAAAYTSFLPMTFRGGIWPVTIAGRQTTPGARDGASARYVTPGYFRVMEIPLLRGRVFTESDRLDTQPVAIISQSFATAYLAGQDPIGRAFTFGPAGERTIVGVVAEVRVRGLEQRSEPQVYMSYQQQPDDTTLNYMPKDLVVRIDPNHTGDDGTIVSGIRQVIAAADPHQPISSVQALTAIVAGETSTRAVQVRVVGAFAVTACLLASIGLYGLLAFVVSGRRREFSVRLALGAEPRALLKLVTMHGVRLALLGVGVGLAAAFAAGRSFQSLLAGVDPLDPFTIAGAVGLVLAVMAVGSLLPAVRAARTNPIDALKID